MLMNCKIDYKTKFFSCPRFGENNVHLYDTEEVTTERVGFKFPLIGDYVVQVSNPISYAQAENMCDNLNLITYNKEDVWNTFKVVDISWSKKNGVHDAVVVRRLMGGDPVHFISDTLVILAKEEKKMSVASTYSGGDGKWLKASDLEGKTHRVVISDTEIEEFKDDEGIVTQKICLSFDRKERSLLLNKTNAESNSAEVFNNP